MNCGVDIGYSRTKIVGDKLRCDFASLVGTPDRARFSLDGTEKGITFETDTMSTITVIGGKSDPIGTAAAMLKDLINIYS